MKKFQFKLKHNRGILTLKVNSPSKVQAIKFVLGMNDNKFEILTINEL